VLSAANLTSDLESDLSNRLPDDQASASDEAAAKSSENVVIEWSWLFAGLVLLLVAFDVFWLTRTRFSMRSAS
jgi:hypothetical protein